MGNNQSTVSIKPDIQIMYAGLVGAFRGVCMVLHANAGHPGVIENCPNAFCHHLQGKIEKYLAPITPEVQ